MSNKIHKLVGQIFYTIPNILATRCLFSFKIDFLGFNFQLAQIVYSKKCNHFVCSYVKLSFNKTFPSND